MRGRLVLRIPAWVTRWMVCSGRTVFSRAALAMKTRVLWSVSEWFLLPSVPTEAWAVHWEPNAAPGGQTTQCALPASDWPPVEHLTLRFVHSDVQQLINYSSGFPGPALVPTEVSALGSCDSLDLLVSPIRGQGFALWPHFSGRSNKICWFSVPSAFYLLGRSNDL